MDNDSYNLVRCLVATVARAFYTDSHIVLLDSLFRETVVDFVVMNKQKT